MFLELRECKARSNSVSEQSFCLHRVLYMILSRTATDSFTLNVRKAASARGLSVSIALGKLLFYLFTKTSHTDVVC